MRKRLNPDSTQILAVGFIVLIFVGATLLSLPISASDGKSTDFFSCLFTSTSASCITGLAVADTATHWSGFGQAVILCLVQIGGLGFMTMATLFSMLIRKNISFKERLRTAQSLSLFEFRGAIRIVKHIFVGTLAFEGAGAVILSVRFIPIFGVAQGIWKGVFTSVSAFCNAGFDLFGDFSGEFSSLTAFSQDLTVCLTVALLIIIGGLGFLVWEEIFTLKRFSRFSLFSKMVIVTTGILILAGTAIFLFSEGSNPGTLEPLSPKGKLLAAFFQSVSPRTAGFNSVSLASMREVSKAVMTVLMFIGASSGSTGGGVKVSTVGVLFAAGLCIFRGKKEASAFERRISNETVLRAFALVLTSIILVFLSSVVICLLQPELMYSDVIFECVSAFATVGLSLGITTSLLPLSRLIIMLLMYFGRVGLLTLSYAVFSRSQGAANKLQYPEGKIIIG